MLETSIFIAKFIGIVSVISTLAIMVNYKKSVAFESEMSKNLASIYTSGFVFLIMGVAIILVHSIFVFDWRVIITLLGWVILIKGVGRILFPEAVRIMIEKKQTNRWFILGEILVFFIGVYLLYYGFIVY